MDNSVKIISNLAKDKLNAVEIKVFDYFVKEIFTASALGDSIYPFFILSQKINTNVAVFCLHVLEKSGLFINIKYVNRFRILRTKSRDNYFINYPFVIIGYEDGKIEFSINRYFFYQVFCEDVIAKITSKSNSEINQDIINNSLDIKLNKAQKIAVVNSIKNKFSIITGGPGVGKTTSIKMFLKLIAVLNPNYQVSICTPTGKATNRIKEVLRAQNDEQIASFLNESVEFSTMHSLLGIYPGYKKLKKLTSEVVIIDESSMISLFLFYQLMSAIDISNIKHIVFIGDVNQLPSVEVGNVFKDLVMEYPKSVNVLNINLRSNNNIIELADKILNRNSEDFFDTFEKFKSLELLNLSIEKILNRVFQPNLPSYYGYLQSLRKLTQDDKDTSNDDILSLFRIYNQFMVLCLLNVGQYGVQIVNTTIEQMMLHFLNINKVEQWSGQAIYVGKPIIVMRNNQQIGLYNGDIGIVVQVDRIYKVAFMSDDGLKILPLELIPQHELAYAITVHKTQGSEFDNIMLIVPEDIDKEKNSIYNNQMLYTAVTRAKSGVAIFADKKVLNYMINNIYNRK